MRVVAGIYGGRRLVAPPGDATRPTSDRVREALFSVLGASVAGARVLDLFAGSGALGIEALSRGAASALFVDRAPAAIKAIRTNLDALGIEADVRRMPALAALRTAADRGDAYDLVFLDPPYRRSAGLGRSSRGRSARCSRRGPASSARATAARCWSCRLSCPTSAATAIP